MGSMAVESSCRFILPKTYEERASLYRSHCSRVSPARRPSYIGSKSTRGGAAPTPPPPPLASGGFLLDAILLLLPDVDDEDEFGSVSDVEVDTPLVSVAEE